MNGEFRTLEAMLRERAQAAPTHPALVQDAEVLDYGALDALADRIAASLQRDGVRTGESVAICGAPTPLQAALMVGVLRAGAVVTPMAPSVTAAVFAAQLADAGARFLFADAAALPLLAPALAVRTIALDEQTPGAAFDGWLLPAGAQPKPVAIGPELPFNLIYSSGTTGHPKGIVQSHGMRWLHIARGRQFGYGPDAVTLIATPLYSNTTLVAFLPTLALGGTVVLMRKFDARGYLELAERHRATHTMLVPVQYRRLMALPDFDRFDLASFRAKFCTSAPFAAELKAAVLARWPGGLTELYGMTEGGGTCILEAHHHPDKLHTVGKPSEGHDIRLIDEEGRELGPGETGEIVGHSPAMMTGYHGLPEKTREAEWWSPDGRRFIRTGDIGRFDADGFLQLLDRRKDMIISGGFNIYPSDLEAMLRTHPAVEEAAVIGVPSAEWGETPVAYVVAREGTIIDAAALRTWLNERVGRTQRLADLRLIDELPRSHIGKLLKRELRDAYTAGTS